MRGPSGIPELRLEVLQKLVTSFMSPPELLFTNMWPTMRAESDTIKWESQMGSRGLAPFVPPGSPAPRIAPPGVAEHSAKAAFIKEKMHFDEEFLNNLRQPGTTSTYMTAAQHLAKGMAQMEYRVARRKEWMFAQLFFAGSFSYLTKGGVMISVDYGIPTDQVVTLSAASKWNTGSSRDILGDIKDARKALSDSNGGTLTHMILNSTTLDYLAKDPLIRTLLQKNTFGEGNLFKADDMGRIIGINAMVLGSLLNIPNFWVYDEKYQIRAILTSAVAAAATTVTVNEAQDFAAGETLRLWDQSEGTYEDVTISSIDYATNTLTVSAVTGTYKAAEDYVTMTKAFVPDNKVSFFAAQVDGSPIVEYMEAPFGLDRHYGLKVDKHEDWDPEGVDIRVQDKGLPVLYQKDAIYILDVE